MTEQELGVVIATAVKVATGPLLERLAGLEVRCAGFAEKFEDGAVHTIAPIVGRLKALEEREDRVVEGPPGPAGKDGEPGQRGEAGAAGDVGPQGPQGPAGAIGEKGLDGRDGLAGVPGRDGAVGPKGLDGTNGIDGKDGVTTLESMRYEVAADGLAVRFIRANGSPLGDWVQTAWLRPYAGVWSEGEAYKAGSVVTWAGAVWIAKADTLQKPQDGKGGTDWQLAVKSGRPGRDGKDGTNGNHGRDGKDGKDRIIP